MVQNAKKARAVQLRLAGKSYGEITKILNVSSKGLLSYWFRDLVLPVKVRKKLSRKIAFARKRGFFRFNKERTAAILADNELVAKQAAASIKRLAKNELLLVGAALYWGEGTTKELEYGYQRISFSNSNPIMVKIFMRFLREILSVEDDKIKAGIHIHPNISAEAAKKFWSKVTGLDAGKFYIFNQISRASQLKRPPNFLPYGTINIRVSNRQLFYKIKGYINGIIAQLASEAI